MAKSIRKYDGALPWGTLYTTTATLNLCNNNVSYEFIWIGLCTTCDYI